MMHNQNYVLNKAFKERGIFKTFKWNYKILQNIFSSLKLEII